VRTTQKPLQ